MQEDAARKIGGPSQAKRQPPEQQNNMRKAKAAKSIMSRLCGFLPEKPLSQEAYQLAIQIQPKKKISSTIFQKVLGYEVADPRRLMYLLSHFTP